MISESTGQCTERRTLFCLCGDWWSALCFWMGAWFQNTLFKPGDNAQEYCLTYSGNSIPLFGLTATASFDVLADIERELNIKEDDGNAVVRFENSVRDEINYLVKEVTNTYEGLDNLTEKAIRRVLVKEAGCYFWFNRRQANGAATFFNQPPAIQEIIEHSFKNYLPITTRQEWLQKAGSETEALKQYEGLLFNKLHISTDAFAVQRRMKQPYINMGWLYSCHTDKGWLGIRNGYNSHGVLIIRDMYWLNRTIKGNTLLQFRNLRLLHGKWWWW